MMAQELPKYNKHWFRTHKKGELFKSIFKIIPINDHVFLYNIPVKKKICLSDHNLTTLKQYKTESNPQALYYHNLHEIPLLFVGCDNGVIQILNVNSTSKIKSLDPQQNQNTFCNDIIYHENSNKLINCYNSGTIAFWNLDTFQRSFTLKNVHNKYTYKLRIQNNNLASCGNDKNVVITDLELMQPIRTFSHTQPVWGIQFCRNNQLASVGLFNAGYIWDLRTAKISQSWRLTNNQSSFITELNDFELVSGDRGLIKTFDRRTGKVTQVAEIIVSVQAILPLKQNKIVVAGRGGDINLYKLYDEGQQINQVQMNEFNINIHQLNHDQLQILQIDDQQQQQEDWMQENDDQDEDGQIDY